MCIFCYVEVWIGNFIDTLSTAINFVSSEKISKKFAGEI